jgi:DNA-binding beta-propeller fold protein YncE
MKPVLRFISGMVILAPMMVISNFAQDMQYPAGVAMDERGNILVLDKETHAVWRLDSKGGMRPTLLFRGEALPRKPLYSPSGIAVSRKGEIAIADSGTSSVYRMVEGKLVAVGDPDPTKTPFGQPQALAYDAAGDLIVPDLGYETVFRVKGNSVSKVATVLAPSGVCTDKNGNIIVISASRRILTKIDPSGKTTILFQGAPFEFPLAVAAHPDGSFVVVDGYARSIFRVLPEGKIATVAKGEPLRYPTGIAVDTSGDILVSDSQARTIFRIDAAGKINVVYGAK